MTTEVYLAIPHQGTDVRAYPSVQAAKDALRAEWDEMYGTETHWQWTFDRHENEWQGWTGDVLWVVKPCPPLVASDYRTP